MDANRDLTETLTERYRAQADLFIALGVTLVNLKIVMSNQEYNADQTSTKETTKQSLTRLENNLGFARSSKSSLRGPVQLNQLMAWIITAAVVGLIAIIGIAWIVNKNSASGDKATGEEHKEEPGHSEDEKGKEVKLDPEMIESAGIVTETVTQRPAIARLMVTGAVELNPETTEMATALVGGRIERVFYGVGDNVQKGAVLAVISSPQLAQLHGKMHEAKTKY